VRPVAVLRVHGRRPRRWRPRRGALTDLTPNQRELWQPVDVKASKGQTIEQARAATVVSFRALCALEGVEVPSEHAVLAELA
jgi:hypothetical protein